MRRFDIYGLEFDWFAWDLDDCLGFLASAGTGMVPDVVLEHDREQARLTNHLMNLTPKSSAKWEKSGKEPLDQVFLQLARRGVFTFAVDAISKQYVQLYRPTRPLMRAELLDEASLISIQLPLRFSGTLAIPSELSNDW